MPIVQDPTPQRDPEEHFQALGKEIVQRLRRKRLPQMVDWFDPGLLAKVGMRSMISATLGQYTDQRLIQASTDNADEAELKVRYDYSGVTNPAEKLPAEADGAVWIDYIADLGDGFEATYAMAYLMASDTLEVGGAPAPLPAGSLLMMGGDQVYPDATKHEYESRLRDPYDWAFSTAEPKRKLFAIPGNHDWYDGLSAFSALFCSARDRITGGVGTQIGGWRCHQHRSYFAIKLPHNWWIWGPDIQLADNLDDSQRDYFDLMADQTREGDNIILCLAEPSWLHKNYDNLHEISMLARQRGARICAVIAGDWHHYSRYSSNELGTQFITSGGGGAFAHATHGLPQRIQLKWAALTGKKRTSSETDTVAFNRSERAVISEDGPDFTETHVEASATEHDSALTGSATEESHAHRRAKAVRKEEIKSKTYEHHVGPHIYPPQWKSWLLCLRNLMMPFHNRAFAFLVGIVYFIFAWSFQASDPRQSPITKQLTNSIATEVASARSAVNQLDLQIAMLDRDREQLAVEPGGAASADGIKIANELVRARATRNAAQQQLDLAQKRLADVRGDVSTKMLEKFSSELQRVFNDDTMPLRIKLGVAAKATAVMSLQYILDAGALLQAAEQSPIFRVPAARAVGGTGVLCRFEFADSQGADRLGALCCPHCDAAGGELVRAGHRCAGADHRWPARGGW